MLVEALGTTDASVVRALSLASADLEPTNLPLHTDGCSSPSKPGAGYLHHHGQRSTAREHVSIDTLSAMQGFTQGAVSGFRN